MRSVCSKFAIVSLVVSCIFSCSPARQLNKSAHALLLDRSGLREAHIGISIFDAGAHEFLYNYQGDKYFIPASNTKLFSLYAALRNLGDSLPAFNYFETEDSIYLQPAGDPTFLHPDFLQQPAFDWLKKSAKELVISDGNWQEKPLGYGWSWDDFNSSYMAERSPLPVYGNVVEWTQVIEKKEIEGGKKVDDPFVYSTPEVSWKVQFNPVKAVQFAVVRQPADNLYYITEGKEILRSIQVPFVTNGVHTALDLLRDTLQRSVIYIPAQKMRLPNRAIYSQPVDSMLKIMMHRSDNQYAEQTLLMLSQKMLGFMEIEKLIDTVLKKDFAAMPDKPVWVDGSGLSRYNQCTPKQLVWVLEAVQKQYPAKRVQNILSGANSGTLAGYYKGLEGVFFAKTGTLSGQVALSGYLTTKKRKQLIFSVLVNNHQTNATIVRRGVEKFLLNLYNRY
jgi:serine-type D-Ala-D-Ala carboxypeptidase/endopeptidase (penicillin-binding protein 4)